MQDIEKESFCFDILNQLHDEYGQVDPEGELAKQIQNAAGKESDKVLRYLQQELLIAMKERAIQTNNKTMTAALILAANSRYGV